MTRAVQWSRRALEDLQQQVTFVAADNPQAARTIAQRLRATGSALGVRPIGRPGRVPGTFEKPVIGLPYLIAYAVTEHGGDERISILRVIHTARHWPTGAWPD